MSEITDQEHIADLKCLLFNLVHNHMDDNPATIKALLIGSLQARIELTAEVARLRGKMAERDACVDPVEDIDCGSNSCKNARNRLGVRNNGPCRCREHYRDTVQAFRRCEQECERLRTDLQAARQEVADHEEADRKVREMWM